MPAGVAVRARSPTPHPSCPPPRSVASSWQAPRRPRRRPGRVHLLPLSPPPPPPLTGLDGGPRPASGTQKGETRRRRRRHAQDERPDVPASSTGRRRGPGPAVPRVETPPAPRRAMFKKLKQKISEEQQQLQQAPAPAQVRRPCAPRPGAAGESSAVTFDLRPRTSPQTGAEDGLWTVLVL